MEGIKKGTLSDMLYEQVAILFGKGEVDLTIGYTADPSTGNLIIEVEGLTIDDDGRIALMEREYDWSATVTFTVTGTVTATSRDAAREAVEEMLPNGEATFGYGWSGDISIDSTTVSDHEVDEVY